MLSTLLLATFSLLLINTLYVIANNEFNNKLEGIQLLSTFSSLCGIVFFMSYFSLFGSIKLSVKLRLKQHRQLRIIGFTSGNIKNQIFVENLVMSCFTTLISLFLAIPIANLIISIFKNQGLVNEQFYLKRNFSFQWIYIVMTIGFTILIGFISTLDIKKLVNIKEFSLAKENNQKAEKVKITFGVITLLMSTALISNKATMIDGLGQNISILSVMLFLVSFALIGKWFFLGFVLFNLKLFKGIIFQNTFKSLKFNIEKIIGPITLLMSLLLFSNFSITTVLMGVEEKHNLINAVSLALIVGSFNLLIGINLIFLYFSNKNIENEALIKIGYTKKQVKISTLLEYFSAVLFAILTSIPFILIINIIICAYNNWTIKPISDLILFGQVNGALLGILILVGICLIIKKTK
ncbi:hypothetical protein SCHIN_v1c11670 [Spiroplasma chinense]|uniref:ABC3 transporter permease C-terminal domain-containing protein n=2 Tax=Spiroplasma chinense TaxID=216932 RepID=A0A5B9Y5X5_9MOLU|nr:hypothetical protein SCHIN_v1c11670 [Spiroplasma chinense]